MRIGRRQFLLAAVAGTAAALTRTASGAGPGAADAPWTLAHPDLLAALGPDTVREIGRRYRDLVPAEQDVAALHAAILAAPPRPARLAGGGRPPVAALVGADFAAGRVVHVNGWVLSITEARQCALFSLLAA